MRIIIPRIVIDKKYRESANRIDDVTEKEMGICDSMHKQGKITTEQLLAREEIILLTRTSRVNLLVEELARK